MLLAMDPPIGSEVSGATALPLDSLSQPAPIVLEGSVENFDPVARAAELAISMPRQWCGTYTPFQKGSTIVVTLTFTKVTAIGQMIDLRGNLDFGKFSTPFQGNLNAKSDQLELLPLSKNLIAGMDPGGTLMGLQGINLLGWNSPRFVSQGGTFDLKTSCASEISKAPIIIGLW